MQQNSQMDSLVSAMHVTFDSLEVICMPDTAQVPAVMKRGIVLKETFGSEAQPGADEGKCRRKKGCRFNLGSEERDGIDA